MSRLVCFIDAEDGQVAACLAECETNDICCETCKHNPFPNKIIPEDRVLRAMSGIKIPEKPAAPFEYEPLSESAYAHMIKYRQSLEHRNFVAGIHRSLDNAESRHRWKKPQRKNKKCKKCRHKASKRR